MNPFLNITDFQNRMTPRVLTSGEQLVATDALQVVTNWIVDRLPNIGADDPAAILVTFEVTRDIILYGPVSRLDSFQNVTSHRTEAGSVSASLVEEFVTDRQARMLGISVKSAPVYNFTPPCPPPGSWAAADRWEYM